VAVFLNRQHGQNNGQGRLIDDGLPPYPGSYRRLGIFQHNLADAMVAPAVAGVTDVRASFSE
jgi:hypothetical protein